MLAENLILGGENSGHIICRDRTTTGDGIISALQVLAAMLHSEKNLHDLKAGMTRYPQTLINVSVSGAVDIQRPPILEAVRAVENQMGDHGRVLLRPSGTEPVVRVMVEGPDAAVVERHARELAAVVRDTLSV
jgi:phosphoglucosamine mutase